jgi:uncharacterized membrane protein AbrB (regulator of aidB expression)
MPAILAPILLLVLGIAAAFFWTIWGIPIALLAAVALVVVTVRARKKDPTVATWETGTGIEPTGAPRAASGGAETSNERVGQA